LLVTAPENVGGAGIRIGDASLPVYRRVRPVAGLFSAVFFIVLGLDARLPLRYGFPLTRIVQDDKWCRNLAKREARDRGARWRNVGEMAIRRESPKS